MFDHIGYNVADFARSKAFYQAALAPLGLGITAEGEGWAMIGGPDGARLWFGSFDAAASPIHVAFLHVAFRAASRSQVEAFYRAALVAGGRDNGAPGLRPNYAPDYYAAFVPDPDGHNVEAVCYAPA